MFGSAPFGSAPFGAGAAASGPVTLTVADGVAYASALQVGGYIRALDGAAFSARASSQSTSVRSLVDAVSLADAVAIVYRLAMVEAFVAADGLTTRRAQLLALADALLVSGVVSSQLQAIYAIASAITVADVAAQVQRESLVDAVAINDLLQAKLRGYYAAVESIVLSDTLVAGLRLTVLLTDGVVLDDAASSQATFLQVVRDGLEFVAALEVDDQKYLAWAVNTDSRAAWRYDHYGFNSFAEFADSYLGAMDDGVYVLEGADDAGTDIHTLLRTGIFNFGSASLKRLPVMYWGVTRSGDAVVKVIAIDDAGDQEEFWYKLAGAPSRGLRTDRVEPDGGIESATYQFELINLDGASLDFDSLRLLPVNLSRRV